MRVVVTGMGVVSPIGIGTDQFWTAAVNGVSGIQEVKSFDASGQRSKIAGEIKDFNPATFPSANYIEQTDRVTPLALLVTSLALEDAGGLDVYTPQRLAVSIGSGMGGFATFESSATRKFRNQPIPPFTVLRSTANCPSASSAITSRLTALCHACTTAVL